MSTTSSGETDISFTLFALTFISTLKLSQAVQAPQLHGHFRDFALHCRAADFRLQSLRISQGIAYVQAHCRFHSGSFISWVTRSNSHI
jgi:hypothetical protein